MKINRLQKAKFIMAGAAAACAANAISADQLRGIDEIIVTAQKREQRLQDVPVSVTAFSAENLERSGIVNLRDIQLQTPGLTWSAGPSGGSAGQYFVRGIGQEDWIASRDPGVGTYIDGVYLGRVTGAALDLVDIQRVEVLRGPQGTLFGKNTIGGAINIVSAKPADTFSGEASVSVGEEDSYTASLKVNVPLVEGELLSRFAVLAHTRDGWGRRLSDGRNSGDIDEKFGINGVLDWTPRDNIEVVFRADYLTQDAYADHAAAIALNQLFLPGTDQFVTDPPYFETWAGLLAPNDLDVMGTSLEINVDLGNGISVKSITSYRDMEQDVGLDFDSSPGQLLDQLIDTEQDQFSQEIQFSGNHMDGKFNWLAGLYYFQEDIEQLIRVWIGFPGFVVYNPQLNIHDNKSYAGYLHGSYALTEKLELTAGFRYSWEEKEQFYDHANIHGPGSFLPEGTVQPTVAPSTVDEDWTSSTPKVAVNYHFTDEVMGYLSYSEGFRSGGFNGRPSNINEITPYDPEEVAVYEVGLKATLWDKRLRINAAAFYNDYTDLQLGAQVLIDGAPALTVENAGESEVSGGELELFLRPVANLDLSFGVAYLDQEFTKLDSGVTAVTLDSRAVQTPQWQVNLGVQYTMEFSGHGYLTSRIDYSYKSEQTFFLGGPLEVQKNERLTNASMTYLTEDEKWAFSLAVWNVFDEEYAIFKEDAFQAFGTALYLPARPREWSGSIKFRF